MRKIRIAEHISLDGVMRPYTPGQRCFPADAGPQALSPARSTATPTGVLVNTYRRVDAPR
mgnify:FL=1